MTCHEFKGGIGTSSRVLPAERGGYTVGALVQANYGNRDRLTIDGVPVGREIQRSEVPAPDDDPAATEAGSIIVVVATDAPLLPHQCERLAQRAGMGIARVGGVGAHSSGDIFLAFATGNRGMVPSYKRGSEARLTMAITMMLDANVTPLFEAVVDATEEAVVNALFAAQTMIGRDGITAHALPIERLMEVMAAYGRGPGPKDLSR